MFRRNDATMTSKRPESLSICFFAGDFAEVLRRHEAGEPQAYGTHREVAMLLLALSGMGIKTCVYSFCTDKRADERPIPGVRILSLGATSYREGTVLRNAIAGDSSEAFITHFPSPDLLEAVANSDRRVMAFLANSFYRRGPRSWMRRRRTVALLNRPEIELVANHCLPATEHLAHLGVRREKLIAWDVPHPFTPAATRPKTCAPTKPFTVMYAGAISEEKGVGDIIRAIRHLEFATDVTFRFAGSGDIGAMRRMAEQLGVGNRIEFLGTLPNSEVFARFQGADLLIVPSRWEFQEGFPLTMFESIASRTPVVCSDHPIFRHVLIDRANAKIFRAGDSFDLARAIDAVLADPKLYVRLSRAAPKTWKKLKGPANWRKLILEWVQKGPTSPWIQQRMFARQL